MSQNELVLIASLILLALFGSIIGFPFGPSLGCTLVLGLVFYLIQNKKKDSSE